MNENIFYKIKRHISQFFQTEYWYRFRKLTFFWFDDEANKYVERKTLARDFITIIWDGDKDILGMMLLKIEHMFHNLKHYAAQADFYFDSYQILENGTLADRALAFDIIMREYDWATCKDKKNWEHRQYNYILKDGTYENRFVYDYDENEKPLYYIRRWNKDGSINYFYGNIDKLEQLKKGLDIKSKLAIIEGVIKYVYSVHISVTEYKDFSSKLRKFARGNRRTLTDLLHLRHLVKKCYLIEDTDDKYYTMWADIKDEAEQRIKMKKAFELYQKDRKYLYYAIADFMAEKGSCWWD